MAAETPISAILGRVSTLDTYPLVDNNTSINALVFRNTIAERDAIPMEMRTGCVCHVLKNADGDKETFVWAGSTWDHFELGTQDIPLAGLTFVNPDGSTTTGVELLALSGLDLKGNPTDGFTLHATGGSALSISTNDLPSQQHDGINHITLGPFLEAATMRLTQGSQTKGLTISIKPDAFEAHHSEGYLAYFDMDEVIIGNAVTDKRKGAIWADKIAWGAGNQDMYAERDTKSVILQDPYNDDPSVTGGAPILCGLHIGFYGSAPNDGTIEFYLWDANREEALLNSAGQPIGVIHHYTQGDKLKPITIAQVYMAKGAVKAQWRMKHTFTDDPVRIGDWAVDGSCILYQLLGKGESISTALNEFQSVIGKPIRVMSKYYGTDFSSNTWSYGFDIAQSVIPANQGMDSVIGIDFENPTPLKVALENSILNIKDDGTNLGLFNTGIELSHEDTINLRGKEVEVTLQAFDRYNALNLVMFSYTGNIADVQRPILTGMNNDQYTLSAGWDKHDVQFLPEHPEGSFHPLTKKFVIPNSANLIMFGVLPNEEQSPTDVSLKPMTINVTTPFTAFEVSIPKEGDELAFKSVSSEFVTYNKIWRINKNKTNIPFGEKVSHVNNAPVELYVEEDDAAAYNGGLKLTEATQYRIEVWLSVQNYYKTKLSQDETVRFWVEDADGNVIADSNATPLILKDGDNNAHIVNWTFHYTNQTEGTIIKLYGQSSSDTAPAFLAQGSYNSAGVMVDAKVMP
ncbi:hypothetical protein DMW20_12050 [Vibrio parahaemolyticus]|nr:hypothetical protein [Vibrio parahaemolyticus]